MTDFVSNYCQLKKISEICNNFIYITETFYVMKILIHCYKVFPIAVENLTKMQLLLNIVQNMQSNNLF